MSKADQRRAKRARAKARKQSRKDELKTSVEARQKHVQKMGQDIITAKFRAGKGKSRHEGKKEGDNFKYITSEKAFRDISAVWRRFSEFVAEHSDGTDLETLDDILKYADEYIAFKMGQGLSAWTLTTYKAHLGKVFNLPTTHFIPTPPRERKNAKRSRRETESDRHISKKKRDFFERVGGALGLRREELEKIKGTALATRRAKNGFWHIHVTEGTKAGKDRWAPILANSPEEEAEILDYFRKAGSDYVFSGKHGTHRVPKKLDEHAHRAIYAKRIYLLYAKDPATLKNHQKTRLRKELRGYVLDKAAEQKVSDVLGHNRDNEFRKSYVYDLLE
ncbi:hypothetical protein HO581_10325 [Streptococcus suis]|uniref:hypothetical protein n=1 Tax=Streptococcus suis TaxID=1307 RepID=UPI0015570B62|nr:hypothetical protein [Streptococcus suis]MCB2944724.1 hypothetical protein [Streptococcus suis]MCB2952642.1 hypothetical protein [Streptococcus suis]MCB2958584.1 hypothetical protein [Streptococcus suis]MCK3876473.1 hypothetical protein [Streptococcus suis]NQI91799.1 hypothetical protein [Streptococcus suis]